MVVQIRNLEYGVLFVIDTENQIWATWHSPIYTLTSRIRISRNKVLVARNKPKLFRLFATELLMLRDNIIAPIKVNRVYIGPTTAEGFYHGRYEIVFHKNFSYSIFKDGKQIGFVLQPRISWFENATLELVCNSDIDIDFVCSMIFVSMSDRMPDPTVAVDINLGLNKREKQAFDETWRPNDGIINYA